MGLMRLLNYFSEKIVRVCIQVDDAFNILKRMEAVGRGRGNWKF